jgi:hypothetical protein
MYVCDINKKQADADSEVASKLPGKVFFSVVKYLHWKSNDIDADHNATLSLSLSITQFQLNYFSMCMGCRESN